MSGKTSINWADRVWNCVTGCTRVSAGCDHCYAFALHDKRHLANRRAAIAFEDEYGGGDHESAISIARACDVESADSATHHSAPRILPMPPQYDLPFSRVQLLPARLRDPLSWRAPQRIFVNSMGDLWHKDVPDEYIDQVFAVMALASWHTFLVLTKRPERMAEYIAEAPYGAAERVYAQWHGANDVPEWPGWPLPNVWPGTSVEDQAAADERIPHLLATPAAVRWVSAEPLLGPIDLRGLPSGDGVFKDALGGWRQSGRREDGLWTNSLSEPEHRLDWAVVGGESGPHARPMDLAWARSLRDQCAAAGVAFFMKQVGAKPLFPCSCGRTGTAAAHHAFCEEPERRLKDRKGGDMAEWPEDLRVRELPS